MLLTDRTALPAATSAELRRLAPDRIVLLGGDAAVGAPVAAALRDLAPGGVTRVAGPDRYATAAAASAAAFAPGVPVAYVTTGQDHADALAAGALGGPVLLTAPDRVPAATRAELARLRPADLVVLGGEQAVPGARVAELEAAAGVPARRLAGPDRFATAAAVAADAFPDGAPVAVLASGRAFPDALAGATAAAAGGGPVLLVEPGCVPDPVRAELARLAPARLLLVGGPVAVGPAVERLAGCGLATSVVAGGLTQPWDVVVAPDGRAFVSESDSGRVLVRDPGGGELREVHRLAVDPEGEGGLLGLAVSPGFAQDGLLYAYLTTARDNRIVRFRPGDPAEPEPVLTGIPAGRMAAGQVRGLAVQVLLELQDLGGLLHAPAHLVVVDLVQAQRERDVLVHAEVGVQGVVLEHHREVAVARCLLVDLLPADERQRVAMGRAIVRQAEAFLFDEPLSNLDAKLRGQMRTEISRLQRRLGITTVYVTHDQTEAMTLGDRVAVLRKGLLQQVASPRELYEQPVNLFVAGFIGSPPMNFLPATPQGSRLDTPFGPIELDERKARAVAGHDLLLVGIRPEYFEDASLVDDSRRSLGSTFRAQVDVTEWLGDSQYAYIPFEAPESVRNQLRDLSRELDSDQLRTQAIVSIDASSRIHEGREAEFWLDSRKIHVFDPESGDNLTRDAEAGAELTREAEAHRTDQVQEAQGEGVTVGGQRAAAADGRRA